MINWRVISKTSGMLLIVEVLLLLASMGAALFYHEDVMPFVFCALCLSAPDTARFRTLTGFVLAYGTALHLLGTVITYNYWW